MCTKRVHIYLYTNLFSPFYCRYSMRKKYVLLTFGDGTREAQKKLAPGRQNSEYVSISWYRVVVREIRAEHILFHTLYYVGTIKGGT